ncbi:transcription initiation factor TFIID subunit 12 [Hyalella azteca]|uniref:Transcription initiation factor TFIID subunit 12 n=1 Tax=Hyalella azteca TaxID=294128 RepID=A0A8B7P9Q9_HYAAZ|nr:transcription initiation factor TFIID subunit 12 [Hyalella azteca]
MSQLIQGQMIPGHVVQGQVVTGGQVATSSGQVVMTSSGVVSGQLIGEMIVAGSHHQHQQPVLQQQQVLQHQVALQPHQATLLQDGSSISLVNNNIQNQPGLNPVQQQQAPPKMAQAVPVPAPSLPSESLTPVVNRSRLTELVREVDPNEQLDEEVEEALLAIADDFIESSVNAACRLAKHRGARTLDVRDLHMYLERSWHMWIPGFGTEELRPYKRAPTTEAHKQRMALIRKAVKKY